MDLEEWEYLPDHGFVDFKKEDEGERKIFASINSNNNNNKRNSNSNSNPRTVFNMNYFICPSSPDSHRFVESYSAEIPGNSSNQVLPAAIQLESTIAKNTSVDHGIAKDTPVDDQQKEQPEEVIKDVIIKRGPDFTKSDHHYDDGDDDQDSKSQVFFKKMKENEFVDMKILDSPKSPSSVKSIPQVDPSGFDFNEEIDHDLETKKEMINVKSDDDDDDGNRMMNLWKWGLTGIGAICSFGVAAATFCIIVIGNQQGKKHQQNQKLRYQIYSDDKRIKQVVQHATKLNEAISAVRGVPITRAHITYGGYYDAI